MSAAPACNYTDFGPGHQQQCRCCKDTGQPSASNVLRWATSMACKPLDRFELLLSHLSKTDSPCSAFRNTCLPFCCNSACCAATATWSNAAGACDRVSQAVPLLMAGTVAHVLHRLPRAPQGPGHPSLRSPQGADALHADHSRPLHKVWVAAQVAAQMTAACPIACPPWLPFNLRSASAPVPIT